MTTGMINVSIFRVIVLWSRCRCTNILVVHLFLLTGFYGAPEFGKKRPSYIQSFTFSRICICSVLYVLITPFHTTRCLFEQLLCFYMLYIWCISFALFSLLFFMYQHLCSIFIWNSFISSLTKSTRQQISWSLKPSNRVW